MNNRDKLQNSLDNIHMPPELRARLSGTAAGHDTEAEPVKDLGPQAKPRGFRRFAAAAAALFVFAAAGLGAYHSGILPPLSSGGGTGQSFSDSAAGSASSVDYAEITGTPSSVDSADYEGSNDTGSLIDDIADILADQGFAADGNDNDAGYGGDTADNSCDVYTFEEFRNAVEAGYEIITVKRGMEIDESDDEMTERLNIEAWQTVIIEENVTVTVSTLNLYVRGLIENHGVLDIKGRIVFADRESPDIGVIKTSTSMYGTQGNIEFMMETCPNGFIGVDDLAHYLNSESVYTSLFPCRYIPEIDTNVLIADVVIDRDYTLPEGKRLMLSSGCTLIIPEGVTLTIEGRLWIAPVLPPVINGGIIGKIENWEIE